MMESTEHKDSPKRSIWGFTDRIEGDKVIWIIVLLLMLISMLAIFSSTPLLSDESRIAIMQKHAFIAGIGLALIVGLYNIKRIGVFRVFSSLGFIASFILLLVLIIGKDFGPVQVQRINGAVRTLGIFGLQFHVFEITKVAMVMYMAWALHASKRDTEAMEAGQKSPTFRLANWLSTSKYLSFLKKPFWKRVIYVYGPTLIVCAMVSVGSGSSAMLIGLVLIGVMMIGGVPWKEMLVPAAALVIAAVCILGIYKASGGTKMKRVATMISRLEANYDTKVLEGLKPRSKEFYDALDDIRQPYGAKVAVHEGGILGKGSGNSTQKYSVTHIYSDFMYSFLLEEYGLWGGILILLLYLSLIARSSMIARFCDNEFGKIALGGLAFLISCQAFLHIFVCVGLTPMTGQTLPLLSDGASAFLISCIAFGIILSISRMANKKMKSAEEEAEASNNDIQARLEILDQLDNENL